MIEVESPTKPAETITPIKPSEAIRLGTLLYPVQAFEVYGGDDGKSACVLGTMYAGYGYPVTPEDNFEIRISLGKRADDLGAHSQACERRHRDSNYVVCPADSCDTNHRSALLHLNDDHKWSRERIADWLEDMGL